MTSTRLPGKVMMEIGGRPMLDLLLERVRRASLVDEIVIATTTNEEDLPIVELADRENVAVYRGSEQDVLGRVVEAVRMVGGDIVVELTGDNPLVDPLVIDHVLSAFLSTYPDIQYASNGGFGDPALRAMPLGTGVSVFPWNELEAIAMRTRDPEDREHVSLFFYRGGRDQYQLLNVPVPPAWQRPYPVRLTVDTMEDLRTVRAIHNALGRYTATYSIDQILRYCDEHREVLEHNHGVQQRQPSGLPKT
jgi:spore coat polysaccharide biosynthesis protein SpsF